MVKAGSVGEGGSGVAVGFLSNADKNSSDVGLLELDVSVVHSLGEVDRTKCGAASFGVDARGSVAVA